MLGIRVRRGAVLLLALVTSCAQESVQGPSDAEFAKGGKPGKPQDDQVTLLEYWIEDGYLIHIVGQGDVDALRLNVAHDYFFNGISDDDYSMHYEYRHFLLPPVPLSPEPDGTFHVDVAWNGERNGEDDVFPDFVVTNVDGADPFAFDMFFGKDGEAVDGIQPQGVIIDGENQGPEATVLADGGSQTPVTSYALYSSDKPPSGDLWIADLVLTDISCSPKKSKGERTTLITGNVHAALASNGVDPDAWLEFHLYDVGTDVMMYRTTHTSYNGVVDFMIRAVLPVAMTTTANLELRVDYVYPIGEAADLVYNPEENEVAMPDGYDVVTKIGDPAPTAAVELGVVQCGR